MTLQKPGKNTSEVEISSISKHGLWLFVEEEEFFLPYEEYPWFKDATVNDILNVTLLHKSHLYWKNLDVDLEVSALSNPEQFPLVYK